MQGVGIREQGLGKTPVRGTQSFVGVMAAVFKRPELIGMEILWRWCFGGSLLAIIWCKFGQAALLSLRDIQTTAILMLHGSYFLAVDKRLAARDSIALLLVALVWAAISAMGRDVLLRRLNATLHKKRAMLAILAIIRVLAFGSVLTIWALCFAETFRWTVLNPIALQEDPAYVFGFAIVIGTTLLLFVFWSLTSWIFRIAPVLAMAHGLSAWRSLRAATRIGALRGKLIEINLVMGIVKIALLVLALVFSACPLPFSTVETQEFLTWWWIGVGLLYLLASDYFHVVRAAAYVTLWKAMGTASPARELQVQRLSPSS